MPSYLTGGLASIDRWEGLKEWHRRHQDLLQERSTTNGSVEERVNALDPCANGAQPDNCELLLKDSEKNQVNAQEVSVFPTLKHDLSIIPEGDEDSRSRNGEPESGRKNQEFQTNWFGLQKTVPQSVTAEENSQSCGLNARSESRSFSTVKGNDSTNQKVVKRPFLRRGTGLVRYNLQPEDVKHPYQKSSVRKIKSSDSNPPKSSSSVGKNRSGRPIPKVKADFPKQSQATGLTAPIQRLVLTIPPKNNTTNLGTWSQVFGGDKKPVPGSESNLGVWESRILNKQDTQHSGFENPRPKLPNVQSPKKKINFDSKASSSPEEDQESLAAYLDLEQHVGNSSFCSTSSKVDTLLAKSSKSTIHQSNPDAITQSKPQTPIKTGRRFLNCTKDSESIPEDHPGMWSSTELQDLIKACGRQSGTLIKPSIVPKKAQIEDILTDDCRKEACQQISFQENADEVLVDISSKEPSVLHQELTDIDWIAQAFGPTRKPHLMKTMSNIDLDSSLVKNALIPTSGQNQSQSEFYTESSSSDSSSDREIENNVNSERNDSPDFHMMKPPTGIHEVSDIPNGNANVLCFSQKPTNDAVLAEINDKIESHLLDLRKEIETLQSSKGKTQKYLTNLEKKVQELEHRLILEARSFNKRLEDERESAAKRLLEEQRKFAKEKLAFQRTLREERRKAPDPITQQELLHLKQEIATWEERWRTDRAKARGLESNLRIQITNLKRENEKLKEENCKLRREKEAALSTAKAKASCNTRVINSIAQNLGSIKPKVSTVRDGNIKQKIQPKDLHKSESAYNLKMSAPEKTSAQLKSVTTIENFPRTTSEWSSDEEVDLGKDTSDEEEMLDDNLKITANMQPVKVSLDTQNIENTSLKKLHLNENGNVGLEEAQAKYDAMFGNNGIDPYLTTDIKEDHLPPPAITLTDKNSTSPKVNQFSSMNISENFVKSINHPDGTVEQIKENGTKVITYPDGTWKRHSCSGSIMTVPPSGWPVHISYFNGDQLEKLSNGTTRYFYSKTNIWQTTYPDGHEELQHPSGQVEHREPDGSVRILLPSSVGEEVSADVNSGITVEKLPNGDTIILLPNGERELHTKEYMKKDFLDGTVKFLFKDGSQETRYPSGRIRVKDAQGMLVKDTIFDSS